MVQEYQNLRLMGLFSKVTLYDVQIEQCYNDHAKIWIRGMIPDGDKDQYVLKALENEVLCLIQLDDKKTAEEASESKIIFNGVVSKAQVKHRGGLYFIELEGMSFTNLLDIALKNRSFQNVEQSYGQVIQDRMEGLNGQYINEDKRKNESIGRFTLQYLETRWTFIKRLVSRHNQGLIPDVTNNKIAYWVGMPQGGKAHLFKKISCESFRPIQMAKNYIDNYRVEGASENDFYCTYLPNRMEYYLLGDPVSFQGLALRIISIHSHLDQDKGVLLHDYTLTTENGAKQRILFNEQIRGLSLEGIVIDRRKDFSKIHLYTVDESQDIATASWFRQPTITRQAVIADGAPCPNWMTK